MEKTVYEPLDEELVEERAESLLEVEEELREEVEGHETEADERVDLRLLTGGSQMATVIDVDEYDLQCVLTVDVDGREMRYSLPLPMEKTNSHLEDPLDRLCQYAGVPRECAEELREVPVVRTDDGEWKVAVPRSTKRFTCEVKRPFGGWRKVTLPPLMNRCLHKVAFPLALAASKTRFATPEMMEEPDLSLFSFDDAPNPDYRYASMFSLPMMLTIFIGAILVGWILPMFIMMAAPSIVTAFLFFVSIYLTPMLLIPLAMFVDSIGWADLYAPLPGEDE